MATWLKKVKVLEIKTWKEGKTYNRQIQYRACESKEAHSLKAPKIDTFSTIQNLQRKKKRQKYVQTEEVIVMPV